MYLVLPYSKDFKAPGELWNPQNKTVLCKCSFIWNKRPGLKKKKKDRLLRTTVLNIFPQTEGTLTPSQWSSSGNPVAIQCAWNLDPSVHWNATGEMPVCFKWSSSGFPVAFQWSSSVFQLCKLTQDRHWDTTGWKHQPVWSQWHPSVLVAPVVFQCVPIMQINTGSPLEHHWVLASASVGPVAFQCTCGSRGLPVRSVQWYPSVLTESGLEVIGSGHFPACDP